MYFPCSQAEIHKKMKEMPRIVNKQICGVNYKQKNENIPSRNRKHCLKMPPNTNYVYPIRILFDLSRSGLKKLMPK